MEGKASFVIILTSFIAAFDVVCADGLEKVGCQKQNGGCIQECIATENNYRCSCFPGFSMSRDGTNCEDINECLVGNGGCEHNCLNLMGSYQCNCFEHHWLSSDAHSCISFGRNEENCNVTSINCLDNCPGIRNCKCRLGFRLLDDKKTCIRMCSNGNGGCQHKCIDTGQGGIQCECQKNYVLQADQVSCEEIQSSISVPAPLSRLLLRSPRAAPSCSVDNGGCDINCEETPVGVLCSCPFGFNPHSDRRSCEDIDECATDNGGCHHTCQNSHGSYQCSCHLGYKLSSDEMTCVDLNECELNDTCQYECINSVGSYECICPFGFTKYATARCGDIDECAVNNGGCSYVCENTIGGFNCVCKKGFLLHSNKKDCVPIDRVCTDTRTRDEQIVHIGCSNTINCFLKCQSNERFFTTKSPQQKYIYACGRQISQHFENMEPTRYQWITSSLFNASETSITGTRLTPDTIKLKIPARQCNLGLNRSKMPLTVPNNFAKTFVVTSILIVCEQSKKKRRRSIINIEIDVLLRKPKVFRKCTSAYDKKRKIVRASRILKQAINIAKSKFNIVLPDYHFSIEKRGGFDAVSSVGCSLGWIMDPSTNECVTCQPGTRYDIKTESCIACQKGYYQDKPGQISCIACPNTITQNRPVTSASLQRLTSIATCTGICQPGSYSMSGFKPCIPCPRGTYQPDFGRTSCYVCGTGITTDSEGTVDFSFCAVRAKCNPGHYYDTRVSTCIRCPTGFYQVLPGQNFCVRCPSNTTTDFDGASTVDACKDLTCGGSIGDFHGVIESPNYPGDYPVNCQCQWTITPPKGRRILLVVPDIYLAHQENCGDILVMRKSASDSSLITYESCQSYANPIALTARSKRLWIKFSSDSRGTAKGFQIPYVTYDEDYDTIIKNIVSDGRLYSANYHQGILKDKQSRQVLFEVLAHPENYFRIERENFFGLFPKAFINFLQEKVLKILNI